MPPKRTSTSETPAITLDALRQLIADFTAALEAQAAAMANADNPNRNTGPREPPEIPRISRLNSQTWYQMPRNSWKVYHNGLPQKVIEGNVTASKPQTLEEAINIAHRLMDQIIKRDSVLETNDRKRKLEDERNIINNNNNNRNNDYHRQQN
ncbi:hypothetical protein Tco_0318951 [Tanacetum coccineum]